jgi:hypothetical protein
MLKIHSNPRPGVKPASHRIDKHISGLEVRRSVRMAFPPSFQSIERILFPGRAGNFDKRAARLAAAAAAPP